ncbi:MAG: hypothetical protein ACLFTK_00280 [Anaerolineales bacterium]
MLQRYIGKRAPWRRAANEILWTLTNRRVLGVRSACLKAYAQRQWADTSHFTTLDQAAYQASRRSDTVFVFGSGWSLNEITPAGWAHIAQHNTFGFSMFVYQTWIRTDYHMLREMYVGRELDREFWYAYSQEFAQHFDTNPHFDQTIFLAQKGWRSLTVNRMLAHGMLSKPRRMVEFRVKEGYDDSLPTLNLNEGIVHGAGSLSDAVNLAVIGGWRHIVLTGVDLYDARYFWDDAYYNAESFGRDSTATHSTVHWGILDEMRRWHDFLQGHGVHLWVYNPKSLLTDVLPIYAGSI